MASLDKKMKKYEKRKKENNKMTKWNEKQHVNKLSLTMASRTLPPKYNQLLRHLPRPQVMTPCVVWFINELFNLLVIWFINVNKLWSRDATV